MILVDTSVWIDHLRGGDRPLASLLEQQEALVHPFVIGELALGNMKDGASIIEALQGLPSIAAAPDSAVVAFIQGHQLQGSGVGYVDAHLLAAAQEAGVRLWTRDKRLGAVARRLSLSASDE